MLGAVITPRAILVLAVLLFAAAVAGVTLNLTQAQSANGVYDTDGDKLIEIGYLEQLNALRYDPNGDGTADNTTDATAYAAAFPVTQGQNVCDSGCEGYELANALDFKKAGSYKSGTVSAAWTSTTGDGWTPIIHTGANSATKGYGATFEGNGKAIANLYSKGTAANRETGLFAVIESGATVKNIGLTGVNIVGGYNNTGALAGNNKGSMVFLT